MNALRSSAATRYLRCKIYVHAACIYIPRDKGQPTPPAAAAGRQEKWMSFARARSRNAREKESERCITRPGRRSMRTRSYIRAREEREGKVDTGRNYVSVAGRRVLNECIRGVGAEFLKMCARAMAWK